MRLIGFGLLAFVLAGVALFLSNSETLRLGVRALSEVALGPRLVFEATAETASTHDRSAIVRRAGPSAPLILSGLPAYQSATFYMPIDAHPISGHLQIDVTVQALGGVEGVLRVSIGNAKRGELLLRQGEISRSLQIQLSAQEIARERLVVSFSLQGRGPHMPCGIDDGIETIVEIEASSGVYLELETPLQSPMDMMLVNGRSMKLSWLGDDPLQALAAGRDLRLSGIEPVFVVEGYSASAAEYVAAQARTSYPQPELAWSEQLSNGAALFGARRFHRSHTWRLRYDMTDGASAALPDQFILDMRLGALRNRKEWNLSVTFNGRLLETRWTSAERLELTIPLADVDHRRLNRIEITASAEDDTADICSRGPELIAEVLPSTSLPVGSRIFSDPLADLLVTLRNGWTLSTEPLSLAEAEVASTLLAHLPESEEHKKTPAQVHVLPRGFDLHQWPGDRDRIWLASFDDFGGISVSTLASLGMSHTREVTLLVDLNGLGA